MDAIEAAKKLIEAGIAPAQAEAHARVTEAQSHAVAQAAAHEEIAKNAASKTKFGNMANKVSELPRKVDKLALGFAELRGEFRIIKWFMLANTAAVIVAVAKIIFPN